jgi:hypothetical protein
MFGTGSGRVNAEENVCNWEFTRFSAEENV